MDSINDPSFLQAALQGNGRRSDRGARLWGLDLATSDKISGPYSRARETGETRRPPAAVGSFAYGLKKKKINKPEHTAGGNCGSLVDMGSLSNHLSGSSILVTPTDSDVKQTVSESIADVYFPRG